MKQNIFRESSIERLSSPEQLDMAITVTNPRAWIALCTIMFLLASAIVWSITGRLYSSVDVTGILVRSGGTYNICADYSGQIYDISVQPGDYVNKGDVVARIDQTNLVNKINAIKQQLKNTSSTTLTSELTTLQQQLKDQSYVTSPENGYVTQVYIQTGTLVNVGTSIMQISITGSEIKNLVAIAYVPVSVGEQLTTGSEVHVSPANVQKEQYGYINGTVASISDMPVTLQGVQSMVGSASLAEQFIGSEAMLQVEIDLATDSNTISGFEWSTAQGPPMKITNGTLCSNSIIISQQRPIEMVVPAISKLFGNS